MLIGIDASRATLAQRTGTETYSLHLIRALLELGTGHRFRLYTNGQPPEGLFGPVEISGVDDHAARNVAAPAGENLRSNGFSRPAQSGATKVATTKGGILSAEIRSIPFPRFWTHLRLSAEMALRPPDVLFVPAHVIPLLHPAASVVTVHDLGYLHYPESHRAWDRRYLDWSTRWSARQAAAVLVDSAATGRDLGQAYGISPAKIHVVYLGRDERLRRVEDHDLVTRTRVRYNLGKCYLLYVGTLQPRKNLLRVVEAFARLAGQPELKDVQLVLAGKKGWSYDALFARVSQLGLEGRVIFPGYVPAEDLPALLSGAIAFVYPSLYEGFGIPVLEAGACGVPVITSNTSSLPEVAGDAAILVDPHDVDAIADAMYRIITDEALRAELARRGLENVKRFSWEKCARETLAVLEQVAKRKAEG